MFVLLDTRRGAEEADATRFADEARNEKPTSKDLDEGVNRRQDAITQMEKERSGLLGKKAEVETRTSQRKFGALSGHKNGHGGRDFGDGDGAARRRVPLGEGISSCRSKGPTDELIERTYDCVIASQSPQGEIKNMEVVEDFEPRPHKEVTFLVERDKEIQELRERW